MIGRERLEVAANEADAGAEVRAVESDGGAGREEGRAIRDVRVPAGPGVLPEAIVANAGVRAVGGPEVRGSKAGNDRRQGKAIQKIPIGEDVSDRSCGWRGPT